MFRSQQYVLLAGDDESEVSISSIERFAAIPQSLLARVRQTREKMRIRSEASRAASVEAKARRKALMPSIDSISNEPYTYAGFYASFYYLPPF
ncbi:uncharacterized protein FIBRA_01956 [Fibroporia radiculosa]|uniref:Uncharacterized protein n=1 Tax=Fibroporia radiculosa TaxID=599839 RepID=J4I8S7_9APHY|nr:uncharacterized protein FIBRA_01956 [Fibroporia radiculosa]CCL99931.1 predicted protein [Fibroporia radiculosa]